MLLVLAALLAAGAALPGAARAQDAADSAWVRGDTEAAARLYEARLAADSADATALHRLALVRAWSERYDEGLALFGRLLALDPGNREARVDRARVLAWRGDPRAAAAALDDLLARDPGYLPALQARAQFLSWAGSYDEALATYGRILEIAPEDRAAPLERARVLSWASRFEAAGAAYDSLLARDPRDRAALLGLAQVMAGAGRTDSATVLYRRVLDVAPGDADALRGVARSAAWGGRLRAAEREWRRALAASPRDVASLVGLSQTLRWQGRDAAALETVERALRIAPTDRDARAELAWVRRALRPRAAPSLVYETDSDGNRIATTAAGGAWRPVPRVELRGEAYLRRARVEGSGIPESLSQGGAVTVWTQLEPGWSLAGTLGVSGSDAADAEPVPTLRAALATPGRYPVGATLAYARGALDGTALLALRRVETEEWSLAAQAAPAQGWTLAAGASTTEFRGAVSGEENRRVAGSAALTRRVARPLTLGVAARAFRFDRDLTDGYFDPDFYGVAEGVARVQREGRRWVLSGEVAPGWQRVTSDGDPSGSLRGTGGLALVLGSGRQVGVSAAYANSGFQALSPTAESDYRYRAFSVTGAWSF